MRVTPVLALALTGFLVVGCTSDVDPEVMGLVLESPSPSEADVDEAMAQVTGPELPGPDALPTGVPRPAAPRAPAAAPRTAVPAPPGPPAAAEPTEGSEPAPSQPADQPPPAQGSPSWRLPTTDGESGMVWRVAERDDGAGGTERSWVEMSSTVPPPSGPDAPERMPLRTGLRPPTDDGNGDVRNAGCTAGVHADPDVDVLVDGTIVHELVVDGEVVESDHSVWSLRVRAGSGPAIASVLGPVEVALADTDSVTCRVSFVASG